MHEVVAHRGANGEATARVESVHQPRGDEKTQGLQHVTLVVTHAAGQGALVERPVTDERGERRLELR